MNELVDTFANRLNKAISLRNIKPIELAEKKDSSGYFWDKVVLSNGSKGYVSRTYLTQISIYFTRN